MPEDGPRGLESDGTEAASATRVGAAESAGTHPGKYAGEVQPGAIHHPAPPTESAGAPSPGPLDSPGPPDRTRRRYWAPWLIAILVFAVYATISLFRYLQLDPSSWDLGIFTELVKQYAHLRAPVADVRGAGVNLLGDHFSPIVALIAPFFLVAPSPVTLLVAQSFLTAVSVLPVTWAAADKLGAARAPPWARRTGSPGACSR